MPPTGHLTCNPGMCPDWESNWRPLVRRLLLNPLSYTRKGFNYTSNPLPRHSTFCFHSTAFTFKNTKHLLCINILEKKLKFYKNKFPLFVQR